MIFYAGLPLDFTADYVNALKDLRTVGFKELILQTLNPLTPAWFFSENMLALRPLTFLYLKSFETVFGVTTFPIGVGEAVSCGLICSLLYYVIRRCGLPAIYGILSIALYLTFPSNPRGFLAFPQFEYFNTLLRFLPVLLFGSLTLGAARSRFKFIGSLVLVYVLVLLAIKLRSSEKILPPLFLAFLTLGSVPLRRGLGWKRYGSIFLVTALLFFSVVPLAPTVPSAKTDSCGSVTAAAGTSASGPECGAERKEGRIKSFRVENLVSSLFSMAPPSRDRLPRNFMETYGIVLGPFFWIFLFLGAWTLLRSKDEDRALRHFFYLFLLWFGLVSLSFGSSFTASQIRYLNFTFLPSVVLLFLSATILERRWSWKGPR